MAKAKTKAAAKGKPAKTQARASAARPAKAPKKAAAAKAVSKPAKIDATKTGATKVAVAKPAAAKPARAVAAKAIVNPPIDIASPEKVTAPRKTEPLTLPVAKQVEAPVIKPRPAATRILQPVAQRADLPPPDGFTLLVDGHFKNQFGDLNGAKQAATELKTRFPMLRIEIYDAANKARLPA